MNGDVVDGKVLFSNGTEIPGMPCLILDKHSSFPTNFEIIRQLITQQIILYNIHVHMYVVSLCLFSSVSTESIKLLENYNLQYNSSHELEGHG